MKKVIIKVCWGIILICFLIQQYFDENIISFIAIVIGFFSFATYAITVLIKGEDKVN
ncbi:hypothetical protein AABM38_11505 [Heyndrickxia sp. MSNUG]|uniref:hypothetical protein n=1 Tax=Heyndrickxia sp. MSNUG TaxID=3136677 RepID=UPI003C30678B